MRHVENFNNWLNEDFDPLDPTGKFKGYYSEFRIDGINEQHAEALKKFIKDFPGDYVQVCERNRPDDVYEYLVKTLIRTPHGWQPSDSGMFSKYDDKGSLTYSYREKPFPIVIDWYKGHNSEYLFFLRKEDAERIIHEARGYVHGKKFGL